MSKFSAIVCDHCGARDVLDYPVNNVKSISVQIDGAELVTADLCQVCHSDLKNAIIRASGPQACKAEI